MIDCRADAREWRVRPTGGAGGGGALGGQVQAEGYGGGPGLADASLLGDSSPSLHLALPVQQADRSGLQHGGVAGPLAALSPLSPTD